ncbi:MAG: hypothetical protein SFV52_14455 [Saprospiraceae bacterium]|nr:hypothetical protein [Saprospiraceae bacterium]
MFVDAEEPPFSFTWRATEDGAAVLHERTETAAQSPYLLLVCPDAFDVAYGGGVLGFAVIWWGDRFCGCSD